MLGGASVLAGCCEYDYEPWGFIKGGDLAE